jgi:ARG and Rhodanese-Phosphatase-superfamily-associated Protein domain
MRIWSVAPVAAAAFAAIGASSGPSLAEQGHRLSGPHSYENLAVYFVHGVSASGAVPLTLQEAVAKGRVQVIETGRVNELQIENTGTEPVFVQAGDIVKGGKQDRVLTVSFLLPAKSGRLPIASFCVEQGRWTARGKEDVNKFSSASEAMPSRAALLAMAAPAPAKDGGFRPAGEVPASGEVAVKQKKVWDSVATTQSKLADGLNSSVASPTSATSLQLSLENETLQGARASYLAALKAKGEAEPDILGYVVAINGHMSSANLYPSNAMFRKMWDKQLAAVVTEAIGEKSATGPASPAPAVAKATEFLAEAERGKPLERAGAAGTRQETRDGDKALYNEARGGDGGWLHRSYLAK